MFQELRIKTGGCTSENKCKIIIKMSKLNF